MKVGRVRVVEVRQASIVYCFGTCVVIDGLDEQAPPELPFETLCKLCMMYINLHST